MWHSTFYCMLILFISATSAFHVIEDFNKQYTLATHKQHYLVSDAPVRYDNAQLWRIFNISDYWMHEFPLSLTLESRYGVIILNENVLYLDIGVANESVNVVRDFLDQHNIANVVVRHENIQELIDAERPAGQRKKRGAGRMDWKDYHDLETIYNFMDLICEKHKEICKVYVIGKTAEGRDLKVMRISNDSLIVEKKICFVFSGFIANEWASQAATTYMINKLLYNWNKFKFYVRSLTYFFIPVANPDGFVYSQQDRLWMKNRAKTPEENCIGVNLLFNFHVDWVCTGSAEPCSNRYQGTAPFSEAETNAIDKFVAKVISIEKGTVVAFLNYRNFGQVITYPWGFKSEEPKDKTQLEELAKTVALRIKHKTGKVYDVAQLQKVSHEYEAHPTDWARNTYNVKFVYEINLRGKNQELEFLLPTDQLREAAEEGFILLESVAGAVLGELYA